MRALSTLMLIILAVAFNACQDTPTATATGKLGKMSLAEFRADPSYSYWFETGYDSYPGTSPEAQTRFKAYVEDIKSKFDTASHTVLMVVKPTCSCQKTQQYMPQVVKTLIEAKVPESRIEIYVTDARLAGFDSVRTAYNINEAPTFMVLRNGNVKGQIVDAPATERTVEQELADFFAKP